MSSVTESSVLTPSTAGKKASTAKKPTPKAPAKAASANTANNSNTSAANATESNKEKDMSTSTATVTEPTGTSEASDFVVTTEPPKFVSGQGRGKSQLRLAIEGLNAGQYLQVGTATEKLKNSTRSMVSSIQTEAKTRGEELAFSVREDAEGNLWVGRKDK